MTHPAHLLPASSLSELAIKALAGQGQYGTITSVAGEYSVRREQVYGIRDRARVALNNEFNTVNTGDQRIITLHLTEEDIVRTVIGLRVMTPSSIRDEVAMLPLIYGTGWSFGKIQGILEEAGRRAAAFHAQVDLSGINHVALDEMFSQGKPVFAGIDLDTQYLFQLGVHPCRTGEEWESSLVPLRDEQGLRPMTVTKDAGTGLRAGVEGAWPDAEHNDDIFHALRAMSQEAYHLERRAYATITQVQKLERKRGRAKSEPQRRSLGQQLRQARTHARDTCHRTIRSVRGSTTRSQTHLGSRGSGQWPPAGSRRSARDPAKRRQRHANPRR